MASIDELRLRAEQDRDEANAVLWMLESTDDAKVALWAAIQAMGEENSPLVELIYRCAQLGFTHAYLLARTKEREDKTNG